MSGLRCFPKDRKVVTPAGTLKRSEWPRGNMLRPSMLRRCYTREGEPIRERLTALVRCPPVTESRAPWMTRWSLFRKSAPLTTWRESPPVQLAWGILTGEVHLALEQTLLGGARWFQDRELECDALLLDLRTKALACSIPGDASLPERLQLAMFQRERARLLWMLDDDRQVELQCGLIDAIVTSAPLIGEIVAPGWDIGSRSVYVPLVPWAAVLEQTGDLQVLCAAPAATIAICYERARRLYAAEVQVIVAEAGAQTGGEDEDGGASTGWAAVGLRSASQRDWSPSKRARRCRLAIHRLQEKLDLLVGRRGL